MTFRWVRAEEHYLHCVHQECFDFQGYRKGANGNVSAGDGG